MSSCASGGDDLAAQAERPARQGYVGMSVDTLVQLPGIELHHAAAALDEFLGLLKDKGRKAAGLVNRDPTSVYQARLRAVRHELRLRKIEKRLEYIEGDVDDILRREQ